MFVSFRKCSRRQIPDPISDHNCQNLYPFSDQNGSKTIPFGAAHTYIPYIGEYPPRDLPIIMHNEEKPKDPIVSLKIQLSGLIRARTFGSINSCY